MSPMNNTTEQASGNFSEENAYQDLIPVLIQCFTIIFLGYVSGRCSLITGKGAEALNTFVTYFSLPSLIFSSLVTLNFSNVRWPFLASVFLAKTIVFVAVSSVTQVLTRPSNCGIAGLYAIFSTQSNDYALGYPLVSSLYRRNHTYFAEYIYLLVPIQLLILNPIGFFLMEIHKQRSTVSGEQGTNNAKKLIWSVTKGILTNPIIALTALGIVGNFAFGHDPPKIPMMILETLGGAFPALALFMLGQNMVGKISFVASGYGMIEPAVLILVKVIVLPLIIRELVHQLPSGMSDQDRDDFASFGFLYGTFPTAPSVFLFAIHFGLNSDIVSTGMVACTVISAPLMLISGAMITLPVSDFPLFRSTLIDTVFWVSVVSLICGLWVVIVFVVSRKWKSITHSVTINLALMQCVTGIGGMMWRFIDSESNALFYSQYIVAAIGVFSCRVWTAYLAGTLAFLQWRSLCFVLAHKIPLIISGHVVSAITAAALVVGIFFRPPKKYIPDPNFQFGQPEAYVAIAILSGSLLFTIVSLIVQQRLRSRYKEYEPINTEESDTERSNFVNIATHPSTSRAVTIPDLEDLPRTIVDVASSNCAIICAQKYGCSTGHRKRCTSEMRQYLMEGCRLEELEREHEFMQHIILLIFLSISMTLGLAVCIWKIIGEDTTGIFVELEFLDAVLNFGQGIFTFLVFGLDWYNFISKPLTKLYRKIRFGTDLFALPPRDSLNEQVVRTCHQFYTYHYDACVAEVVSDKRVGRRVYPSSFRGKELVTWLVAIGLAEDRKEAEQYGRQLLLGRVLRHTDITEDFYDDAKIYHFPAKDFGFLDDVESATYSNSESEIQEATTDELNQASTSNFGQTIAIHKHNETPRNKPRVFRKKV